jgi:hypothetical protein
VSRDAPHRGTVRRFAPNKVFALRPSAEERIPPRGDPRPAKALPSGFRFSMPNVSFKERSLRFAPSAEERIRCLSARYRRRSAAKPEQSTRASLIVSCGTTPLRSKR